MDLELDEKEIKQLIGVLERVVMFGRKISFPATWEKDAVVVKKLLKALQDSLKEDS